MNLLLTLCLCAAPPQDLPPAQQQRPEPLPIPRGIVLERGERRIVIDGSLQDWPKLPAVLLDDVRQLSGSALGAYRGRGDIAARVFLMWDAEDLYLAAIVQDDWHIRLNADSPRFDEIPPADALVLTIDPNRDTRSIGRDDGRQEDSEFWIADVENQGRRVVRWDRFRGTARFAEGGAAVVQRDEDKRLTTYEVRLPWAEILPRGQEPAARMVLDLQIVIDDYDEPTDPLPQSRIGWTFGMGTRIDPGLLGR